MLRILSERVRVEVLDSSLNLKGAPTSFLGLRSHRIKGAAAPAARCGSGQ
jgi:hypothetical protein